MNERKQKSIFIMLMAGIIICMLQGIWKNAELSVAAKACNEEAYVQITHTLNSNNDVANSDLLKFQIAS
ncbi:MAG: hypothetical protein IJA36_10165 [Lachnospiraceae bacterium]|nr:hypothetical protein [Lachnospiraceae bacterium]